MNDVLPAFGTLEDVSVRQAWKHEALGLTPWLAENLAHLGSVLGMQLELEGTERPVENFSADVLGNRLVLIENQLEQSDHKHLGQILTYLAGLDSQVMIWVATSFAGPKNGKPTRGANVTSADAILRFRQSGRTETLLIEWKYTESYGAPPAVKRQAERLRRYGAIAFAPDGPIRSVGGVTLTDLFWEPFYQLFRQQMLAYSMQAVHEDGAELVRVLHIAPAANRALGRVTSPALRRLGDNAFTVFRSLLVNPDDFISRSTESLFGPLIAEVAVDNGWASYLRTRYAFLAGAAPSATTEESAT